MGYCNVYSGVTIMSGKDGWKREVLRCRQKEYNDWADVTVFGRLFQVQGAATGRARPRIDASYVNSLWSYTVMALGSAAWGPLG